ncbi:MAG TPA: hypothetical protein VMB66_15010 [Candidatus Acidoferrales bacterium]|nr:hypothetical protein [Candidatus Acidoferrales bacterium]
MRDEHAIVVAFSGIDGAGKSTQIGKLCQFVQNSSLSLSLLTFWDDIVAFSRLRERTSRKMFKGDSGVGSPGNPICRRDKNVRSWYVTTFRCALYAFDALSLRMNFYRRRRNADVLIFDRYIYDELANLPLHCTFVRLYASVLLKIAPMPDVAFVLDANPEAACVRKPEYPLEFVRRNREAYLKISRMFGMTIIAEGSIDETSQKIRDTIFPLVQHRSRKSHHSDLQQLSGRNPTNVPNC